MLMLIIMSILFACSVQACAWRQLSWSWSAQSSPQQDQPKNPMESHVLGPRKVVHMKQYVTEACQKECGCACINTNIL